MRGRRRGPGGGTTDEIAEEALDLIDVEYEVLPAVFDIDSALSAGRARRLGRVSGQYTARRHDLSTAPTA